jgi:hypothetical protein
MEVKWLNRYYNDKKKIGIIKILGIKMSLHCNKNNFTKTFVYAYASHKVLYLKTLKDMKIFVKSQGMYMFTIQ